MRALRALVVVALAASAAAVAEERPPDVAAARAQKIAEILGLEPLLARIAHAPAGGGLEATLVRLQLRDDVLAELQRVSLLIDATVARLDQERAEVTGAQSYVESGYTRGVTGWNIAALLVGSGLTIVGTAMQFDGTAQAYTGDGLILGGAVIATAFSVVALTRHDRARLPHGIDTNYLAPLCGATPTPESELPEPIWRYLETLLPGEPAPLRSQLIDRWQRRGTLPRDRSPAARRKLALLTQPIAPRQLVSADVLEDRAEMLADLRARVAGMHVELRALAPRAQPEPPPSPSR